MHNTVLTISLTHTATQSCSKRRFNTKHTRRLCFKNKSSKHFNLHTRFQKKKLVPQREIWLNKMSERFTGFGKHKLEMQLSGNMESSSFWKDRDQWRQQVLVQKRECRVSPCARLWDFSCQLLYLSWYFEILIMQFFANQSNHMYLATRCNSPLLFLSQTIITNFLQFSGNLSQNLFMLIMSFLSYWFFGIQLCGQNSWFVATIAFVRLKTPSPATWYKTCRKQLKMANSQIKWKR